MISVPVSTLRVPMLQGVTIILPPSITQDTISVWTSRRTWSAWSLKVLIPDAIVGMCAGTLFASHVANAAIEVPVSCTPTEPFYKITYLLMFGCRRR
jgi:hypothetical protein